MFQNWKKICISLFLLAAAINLSAQSDVGIVEGEVAKMLLKKDLGQAIKEAESSAGNDLRSLLWRLSLYRRAAHEEKFTSTLKQIIAAADREKDRDLIYGFVAAALRDPFFQDAAALQSYLKNFGIDEQVYGKFITICMQKTDQCDIGGFEKWLAQKTLEAAAAKQDDKGFYESSDPWTWLRRRIDWRERFGFDNTEILNQFVEDVRNNPADRGAALRYLEFFKGVQDINWLAETFTSEQSSDYYELGSNLFSRTRYSVSSQLDSPQIYRIAAKFLQKSLNLPFTEKDKSAVWSRFRYASIPPVIKNPEKQLRFWTKTELAEIYKALGEAQNAQPIIEELMSTDTSDIVASKPSELAGAVQSSSGARVVESKILSEQGARQNSYEYWVERVAYYEGRQENERVFDAYKESLAAVPFDLTNENSRASRLYFIGRFADFVEDKFERYANDEPEDLSAEEKAKQVLWFEAEKILRSEFEKNRANVKYSYELARIISENGFEKLSGELLSRNPELLVSGAKLDLMHWMDGVIYEFFKSEAIPPEKKDLIFDQILKITEKKNLRKAWIICEALKDIEAQPKYAARVVPILVKNLKIAESSYLAANKSDDDYYGLESLHRKYTEILFSTYLAANDWKSAEKLFLEKSSLFSHYSLEQLALNAARSGAFADAARFWKIKANTDRSSLENLSSLKRYPAVVENLREFYEKMRTDEPFSTIPGKALDILK